MNVLVTGGTGFIGRHLVGELLRRGHRPLVLARRAETFASMTWHDRAVGVIGDLASLAPETLKGYGTIDRMAHLAWEGLPDYAAALHLERNLPASLAMIERMVTAGVRQVLVAGTAFEYGMQEGALDEGSETRPVTAYGQAKDQLRKELEELRKRRPYILQWARLFYLYGPGQNPRSLMAQLDAAIERGDREFPMSDGAQLRDYLPVEEVARLLAALLERPGSGGTFNCCSGKPVSVLKLVEERIASRGASIAPRPGVLPRAQHEPGDFWGRRDRLDAALGG